LRCGIGVSPPVAGGGIGISPPVAGGGIGISPPVPDGCKSTVNIENDGNDDGINKTRKKDITAAANITIENKILLLYLIIVISFFFFFSIIIISL
jgi:hypothetical protein